MNGLSAIAYPALPGEPLRPEQPRWLEGRVRARVADQLTQVSSVMQRFPAQEAQAAGVPVCRFPFAFEEDHLRLGDEQALYAEDRRRVQAHAAGGRLPGDLSGELTR